jgi:hypothetical protein
LVEFALILPLMLLLILGVFQIGLGLLTTQRLQHAAQQASTAGNCAKALEVVEVLYGSIPDSAQCAEPGSVVVEVVLTDAAPLIGPWGEWRINASGRTLLPTPSPVPSP